MVSVTPDGLEELKDRLLHDTTKIGEANLSTLERLTAHAPENVADEREIERWPQKDGLATRPLRVKLFNHKGGPEDAKLVEAFRQTIQGMAFENVEELPYARSHVYRMDNAPVDRVRALRDFVGVQSVQLMPQFDAIRTQSRPISAMPVGIFPSPEEGIDYPVVGVVDSGTDPTSAFLSPWCIGRADFLAAEDHDYSHGSFVSGLIANARRLNHSDGRFPQGDAKFFDCVALGKSPTNENELLEIIDTVLANQPDIRIWNLSLGGSVPCIDDRFSDLAVELDVLQDKYNVIFVIAAGNMRSTPLRPWPPTVDLGESDRICPPADSIRGLTVGSVASSGNAATLAGVDDPSPFSLRGPGPAFTPKPEVVHYGGNCDATGACAQSGTLSIDAKDSLAEDIGTSFSAPLVTAIAGQLYSRVSKSISWQNVLKAMIVHSAALGSDESSVEHLQYRGFGIPASVDDVVNCPASSATLMFEAPLVAGVEFERWPLPMPPSLLDGNGAFKGEIVVTLAYDPPFDPDYGPEYCRANVEVSIGTYNQDANGKWSHTKKLPEHPKDVKKLYEHEQIKHGFKWSPIKVYRRFFKGGVAGDCWRLNISMQRRFEALEEDPQNFAVFLTIRDPEESRPIYDEVVREAARLGWITTALDTEERTRVQS